MARDSHIKQLSWGETVNRDCNLVTLIVYKTTALFGWSRDLRCDVFVWSKHSAILPLWRLIQMSMHSAISCWLWIIRWHCSNQATLLMKISSQYGWETVRPTAQTIVLWSNLNYGKKTTHVSDLMTMIKWNEDNKTSWKNWQMLKWAYEPPGFIYQKCHMCRL